MGSIVVVCGEDSLWVSRNVAEILGLVDRQHVTPEGLVKIGMMNCKYGLREISEMRKVN